MIASQTDSVLIEQVVYLASKARVATGQDPIFDIPHGTTGSNVCPIARALNLNCSVSASVITFKSEEHAKAVAEAVGLAAPANASRMMIPTGHPFHRFVLRFDSASSSREMQRLKKG